MSLGSLSESESESCSLSTSNGFGSLMSGRRVPVYSNIQIL
jgi:hypothetical protein